MISKNSWPNFMTILGFVVAFLFVLAGAYIIFSEKMHFIPRDFRLIFGVVVIIYGFFRSVIIYQKSKQQNNRYEE